MPFTSLTGYEKIFYDVQGNGDCVLLMLPGSIGL